VTVVDTGPLVALFDPKDREHARCVAALKALRGRLYATVPVLTQAFHLLQPASIGSDRLRDFVVNGGLSLWFLDNDTTRRSFELMEQYADHPMDLADASLVAAAESLDTRTMFTLDRRNFTRYRIRRGHRHVAPDVVP
jgi:predicted nucleic acid-binding protein